MVARLIRDKGLNEFIEAAKLLKDFHDIIENPFYLWLKSKDMKII